MAKILIVEDDVLISTMYKDILTFDKYDVVTAGDGQEGLEKAVTEKPTLILLDIMMPKMNGLEFLEKLKSNPETKEIPVIVMTNLSGDHDAQAALTKGAVKYIVKSKYTPKEVAKMVKEILAGYTRNEIPTSK